ncbi:hypothetical protein AMAG_03461 [Allomyces macrogynus ATCC 38327]|uniref:Uncharacterized protein n=1 Tax=Allomyces macrogynus (strain ATCC 38327) TaxID=578462 RepID=A0A0L0S9Q9_ALLM3|nr:hypothetical protein AMAG_03461 [Allomyces macrogynus ATCC 38327]|eukprot:KNE59124.1 hypothetical protein AMAG_03461 [Allomyces macrogynus ATCC 38327]
MAALPLPSPPRPAIIGTAGTELSDTPSAAFTTSHGATTSAESPPARRSRTRTLRQRVRCVTVRGTVYVILLAAVWGSVAVVKSTMSPTGGVAVGPEAAPIADAVLVANARKVPLPSTGDLAGVAGAPEIVTKCPRDAVPVQDSLPDPFAPALRLGLVCGVMPSVSRERDLIVIAPMDTCPPSIDALTAIASDVVLVDQSLSSGPRWEDMPRIAASGSHDEHLQLIAAVLGIATALVLTRTSFVPTLRADVIRRHGPVASTDFRSRSTSVVSGSSRVSSTPCAAVPDAKATKKQDSAFMDSDTRLGADEPSNVRLLAVRADVTRRTESAPVDPLPAAVAPLQPEGDVQNEADKRLVDVCPVIICPVIVAPVQFATGNRALDAQYYRSIFEGGRFEDEGWKLRYLVRRARSSQGATTVFDCFDVLDAKAVVAHISPRFMAPPLEHWITTAGARDGVLQTARLIKTPHTVVHITPPYAFTYAELVAKWAGAIPELHLWRIIYDVAPVLATILTAKPAAHGHITLILTADQGFLVRVVRSRAEPDDNAPLPKLVHYVAHQLLAPLMGTAARSRRFAAVFALLASCRDQLPALLAARREAERVIVSARNGEADPDALPFPTVAESDWASDWDVLPLDADGVTTVLPRMSPPPRPTRRSLSSPSSGNLVEQRLRRKRDQVVQAWSVQRALDRIVAERERAGQRTGAGEAREEESEGGDSSIGGTDLQGH